MGDISCCSVVGGTGRNICREGRPHLEQPDAAEGKWQNATAGTEHCG